LRALIAQALLQASALEMEKALNAVNVPAAWVRDLGQSVQAAQDNHLIEPWTLTGEATVRVPGLGFHADTLFAGRSAPSGNSATSRQQNQDEKLSTGSRP
jgi:hypothetical protein